MMMLKVVYHLPYRQLIGFLVSIFSFMKLVLPIPHFTTVAERARSLSRLLKQLSNRKPTDLVLDSTGFKIYGEGEWHVRKHGKQKRRRWKKFHIGICPITHEVVVAEVTDLETADCEVGPKLMERAPRSVKRVIGDGAYDTFRNYKTAHRRRAELIVPPRVGSVVKGGAVPWVKDRDQVINEVLGLGADEGAIKLWKKLRGYHRRSLVETSFSRFKGIFGARLFSKSVDNQCIELLLKASAMNKMTGSGMPKGVMI